MTRQQDIPDHGVEFVVLSMMRAVQEARRLLPAGARIESMTMAMKCESGDVMHITLPSGDKGLFAVDRIRLLRMDSRDVNAGALIIVLNGAFVEGGQRAFVVLTSPADVNTFRNMLDRFGSKDLRPSDPLVGVVTPQASMRNSFYLPDEPTRWYTAFNQLTDQLVVFSDSGEFLAPEGEDRNLS